MYPCEKRSALPLRQDCTVPFVPETLSVDAGETASSVPPSAAAAVALTSAAASASRPCRQLEPT